MDSPLVRAARIPDEVPLIRTLFTEYAEWLGVDLCFQGFPEELASLPGKYAPPEGGLYVAVLAGTVSGCCAFRPLSDRVCELKRLWVRPSARGAGLGTMLARRVETDAANAGYEAIVLDTLETMKPAIALYHSLGYVKTDPYYHNPIRGAVYMRKSLAMSKSLQGPRFG